MKRDDQTGFSVIEVSLILVVVGILGFTSWYVYHSKQAANKDYSASSKSTVPTYTKKTAASDSYAGWKSASLKYEKMSFRYPSSWQINNTSKDEAGTGGTVAPGADDVLLTSPTGLDVSIQSGLAGVDSNGLLVGLSTARPINTLGGSYFLVYYANKAQSTTEARGACVSKTATTSAMPALASKNIRLAGISDGSTPPATDLICIGYPAPNSTTSVPVKPVSAFEQDASYADAKLIIESLRY